MTLNDNIPEPLLSALRARLPDDEGVRYSKKSDLRLDRTFGDCYLVATDKHVAVLDGQDVALLMPLASLRKVRVDELFGSGRLMAQVEGGDKTLIYYTKSYVPEFAAFSHVLCDLIDGREPGLPDEDERGYCDSCGSQLPERGATCPLCVPRLKILMRLLGLLMPYRRRVVLMVTMTFVTVVSQLGPPYLTKMIVDDVIEKQNHHRLALWVGLMVLCGVLFLIARLVGGGLTAWLGARVVADLRSNLHMAMQRLRMRYFDGRESGQLIGRVMHDTQELQHFLIDGSSYFLVQTLSFVAIAGLLLHLDAKLAVLVFFPVPFLVGGGRWFWRKLIPLFHKHGTRVGAIHSVLGESIRGLRAVKASSGESLRGKVFDGTNEEMFDIRFRLERTFLGFSAGMFWLMSLGVAAVWYFAAGRIAAGGEGESLTLGKLLAFLGYIWLFYGPLQWFTAILNWMTHAFAGAERIFAVLDSKEEVYEPPDAVELPEMRGGVRFDDVHFSYERGKEVIKGMTFDIAPGEMVGLVGKSGAGKSTLINLICRFYDVDDGSIMIDGHPIQSIKLKQLRSQIGMVMQEPYLFDATIYENIAYGLDNVTFMDVVAAARAARAHDFIVAKEDGYDTIVGERGVKLSGGEKQRLAIARALLRNPPILILDEATSSVDSETEREIQEAMANLIEGRTTIAIAHRLSTLRNADRLFVIEDGALAEVGTHDELVELGGTYARLVRMQSELTQVRGEVWHA